MSEDDRGRPASLASPERLNSWKEIAAYLGKGVRTVERWESDLGLPVHRMRGRRGEIIYALRSEIDQWQLAIQVRSEPGPNDAPAAATHPQKAPAGTPGTGKAAERSRGNRQQSRVSVRWSPAAWAVLLAVLLLVWVGWQVEPWDAFREVLTPGGSGAANPHHARVTGREGLLVVFNALGEKLWQHSFGLPLDEAAYTGQPVTSGVAIVLQDLDNDRRTEVVFRSDSKIPEKNKLYCFNWNGTLRFDYQVNRSVVFGSERFDPPFPVSHFIVTREADDSRTIWVVSQHHLWFPTVVNKLTPAGAIRGEYWNGGHARVIQEGVANGRRVMFVGGTNNEHYSASLAVLDYARPDGAVPATNRAYRCTDCPNGAPVAFLLLPRMAVARALNVRPCVREVIAKPPGSFTITVEQGDTLSDPQKFPAPVFYTVDSSFHVLRAETGDDYRHSCARLFQLGSLPHPCEPQNEGETLRPALLWDGKTFVALR